MYNQRFQQITPTFKPEITTEISGTKFMISDSTNLYIFKKKSNEKFDEFKIKRLIYLKNNGNITKTNLEYNKEYNGCKY